ncbi:MAG: DUF6655 family protein [Thermoguttaceae bacterium]
MRVRLAIIFLCCGLAIGCGTTRWTDTSRTATEQLLIADSIDRAVSRIDFHVVAGKKVFVDTTALKSVNDSGYLISSIRQQVLANGGILKDVKEKADYILEVRAGAVGTDRHDMLVGVPALSLPTVTPTVAAPTQIPEIPLVKKTNQRAIAKIALFVYNRTTGRMVWQSGVVPEESQARALWVFGAGPFQHGSIYSGTTFAGDHLHIPLIDLERGGQNASVSVAEQAYFVEPKDAVGDNDPPANEPKSLLSQFKNSKDPNDPSAQAPVFPWVPQNEPNGQNGPNGQNSPNGQGGPDGQAMPNGLVNPAATDAAGPGVPSGIFTLMHPVRGL